MSIISISGKIGAGKDEVAKIIQRATNYYFEIRRFADNLKDIVCILICCTREQLEDREFKEKELGEQWRVYKNLKTGKLGLENTSNDSCETYILTPRLLLQLIGTECGRQIIHPNIWVNATMADYKPTNQSAPGRFTVNYPPEVDFIHNQDYDGDIEKYLKYPNWIITDTRFPNELKAVKDRGGITIRVNRPNFVENTLTGEEFPVKVYKKEHKSETALDTAEFDYVIDNSGSLLDLEEKVLEILRKEKLI